MDRLQYGAISAFFGSLIGIVVAAFVMWLSYVFGSDATEYKWSVLYFSCAYFFFVGVVRAAEAADVVVHGFVGVLLFLLGFVGIAGGGMTIDGDFEFERSMWWFVVFILGVTVVALLA
ncbi:MAG: hypothetical protein ABI606_16745 [Rhodoferax sp.]